MASEPFIWNATIYQGLPHAATIYFQDADSVAEPYAVGATLRYMLKSSKRATTALLNYTSAADPLKLYWNATRDTATLDVASSIMAALSFPANHRGWHSLEVYDSAGECLDRIEGIITFADEGSTP